MEAGEHIVSLSLGTAATPSAVVVVDPSTRFERPEDDEDKVDWENAFKAIWLERFPAGHPIPAVATRLSELMSHERLARRCHLLLDITSTGAAPLRVLEQRSLYPTAIDLTSGGSEEHAGEVSRVPLRDVIGAAQVVLQTGRLEVASKLEHASTLVADLQGFDPKPPTRGLDVRSRRNSDFVFALAVALWWADQHTWGEWPRRGRPRDNLAPHGWMGA